MKEALVVLGGGISESGKLPVWVHDRLDKTLEVFSKNGPCPIIVSGKGRDDFPIPEAAAMADYLRNNGIPASSILQERLSRDTIQNAYFSRLLFLEPMNIRHFSVITNEFHIRRAAHIFRWVFGPSFEMALISASDARINTEDLGVRKNTESELLAYHVSCLSQSIAAGDMTAIKSFIFDEDDSNALAYKRFTLPYSNIKALY